MSFFLSEDIKFHKSRQQSITAESDSDLDLSEESVVDETSSDEGSVKSAPELARPFLFRRSRLTVKIGEGSGVGGKRKKPKQGRSEASETGAGDSSASSASPRAVVTRKTPGVTMPAITGEDVRVRAATTNKLAGLTFKSDVKPLYILPLQGEAIRMFRDEYGVTAEDAYDEAASLACKLSVAGFSAKDWGTAKQITYPTTWNHVAAPAGASAAGAVIHRKGELIPIAPGILRKLFANSNSLIENRNQPGLLTFSRLCYAFAHQTAAVIENDDLKPTYTVRFGVPKEFGFLKFEATLTANNCFEAVNAWVAAAALHQGAREICNKIYHFTKSSGVATDAIWIGAFGQNNIPGNIREFITEKRINPPRAAKVIGN